MKNRVIELRKDGASADRSVEVEFTKTVQDVVSVHLHTMSLFRLVRLQPELFGYEKGELEAAISRIEEISNAQVDRVKPKKK